MKKLYLICILILVFLSLKSMSQTDETAIGRINEPTLSFTSIDNFGFNYKLEQKNDWYWRFLFIYSIHSVGNSVQDESNSNYSYFTPGIGIGIEKRFQIVKKLQFKTGADVRASYRKNKQAEYHDNDPYIESSVIYSLGQFNLVFGVNYLVNKHILLSLEITPYIKYHNYNIIWSKNDHEQKIRNLEYSFTNKTISLNISYRFWRNKKNN